MTRHVMKHAFTSNLPRSTMRTGENTVAINNKALSMLVEIQHQSAVLFPKMHCCNENFASLKHNGKNKNSRNKSNKEKTASLRCTIDVVSRDTHGICERALLPLRVTL